MQVPTFEIALSRATLLTPYVRELEFERVDGAVMSFEAGQWVNLVLPTGTEAIKRAYSIASPPDGSSRFSIAVTKVDAGPGSTFLHELAVGARLVAAGPQGFFTRTRIKEPGPSLFIGTGTGFTPLRSMLLDAIARGETRGLWALLGVRREADLLYREELESLAREHAKRVRVVMTLSQGSDTWTGRRGYVQTHVRELWAGLCARNEGVPHAYICGLHPMVNAVRELLRNDMGLGREHVHSERYD
jgi:ferredoxin-NADP reductase